MSQSNLIAKSDITTYYDLSPTISETDINRIITAAQRTNFKYWIGEELYYNLCENKADGDKYQALLNGEAYEYTSGKYRYFDGAKMLLIWEVVRLWMLDEKNKSTKSGMGQQRKNNTDFITGSELDKAASYAKGQTIIYHRQLSDYMSAKSANFTDYTGIKPMQQLIF